MLQDKGVPGIVERTLIRPPSSQLGPLSAADRKKVMSTSDLSGKYDATLDRQSAYEILAKRASVAAQEAAVAEEKSEEMELIFREYNAGRRYSGARVSRSTSRKSKSTESFGTALTRNVMKELSGTTGRRLVRGILGSLFKGR